MSKDKKRLVPVRRFKEFENADAWEQRKLGDMGNVITGNTPSTKDKSNWTTDKNKGHIWITPTDINRKVLFDSERYLSDKGWLKARKIPKNSVLITSIASIGKNAINGIDAAFNQQINALILQNNNYYFVLSLMDKEKKRFEALAGQTATPIINKSTFSSFQLQIPSENEQNKIGNFFKKIDNLITLHQRKLDKLKRVKSAYLTEMFPAEGEREPKRRFPGFTGAWEQRKLGDMGNVITGNTPSTKDKSNWTTDKNKGHIWITPTDINRKVLFDSERYLSDKGWLKARKIPKNSVLITSIASIGKNAINGIDAAFNQQINALILQNNNYYFVLSLMDKEKKRFEALAGQTATPIINKSTFSSFQLQIPSENEQNKIGNFFKKIDNLITLHQRKLDKLQKLKNAYLNEMFV